jgi:hypothetical protein
MENVSQATRYHFAAAEQRRVRFFIVCIGAHKSLTDRTFRGT